MVAFIDRINIGNARIQGFENQRPFTAASKEMLLTLPVNPLSPITDPTNGKELSSRQQGHLGDPEVEDSSDNRTCH